MSEELLLLKISNIFSALQFEISSDDINVLSDSLFQVFDSGYVINYTDSYRIAHSLLDGIQASERQDKKETLYRNIELLQAQVIQKEDGTKSPPLKLIDYIKLEFSRYDENLITIENMAQRQNSIFYQVQQDQQKVADEINGMTVRLITVLSIFAGIVIAFSGGIGLLGNSFSALANNDITIYRILFLVLLIGLILYDVIVMLMFIVVRLNSKKTDLGIVCKHYYKDCYLCGSKNGTFANLFCQAINKYPHIFFVNILLLYLMYGLIVMKSYNVATEFFNGNNILFVILWLVVPVVLIFMLCSFLSKPPKKCQNDREEGCG